MAVNWLLYHSQEEIANASYWVDIDQQQHEMTSVRLQGYDVNKTNEEHWEFLLLLSSILKKTDRCAWFHVPVKYVFFFWLFTSQ